MPTLCTKDDCRKPPSFNHPGKQAIFCGKHKSADMVNVRLKQCEDKDCVNTAVAYGMKGDKPRFCIKHKTLDMVNVKHKHCEFKDCHVIANFDVEGGKGRFCRKHKEPDMIDIKNKRCETSECKTLAIFDIEGGKGRFCLKHKEPDMVDVKNKRCEFSGCTIAPMYGFKGGKCRFCTKHKEADMINLNTIYCEYEGCDVSQPCFGLTGGKPQFCKKHKLDTMVDLTHRRCEYETCKSLNVAYDVIGGKGRFCRKHKTDDMVNVAYIHCIYEGCKTNVYYGKPGHKRTYCAKHRESGMIRRPNSKCLVCKESAIWGTNWIPLHCETHKLENEVNLIEKTCSSCGLMYILNDKNLCEMCDPELFSKVYLAKQKSLMDYLDKRCLVGNSTDTIVDKGVCGKERPDRVYDFGDKIVILECDEHQHRDRLCSCEQTRMINIGQMFGGLPVYFIRWNPDDYHSKNDKTLPEKITKRYKLVGDLIDSVKDNKIVLPSALISVLYMYYDGWTGIVDEKWNILMAFES